MRGQITTKEKKKAVLSQDIALVETWKYSEEVVEIAANDSHYEQVSIVND